MPAQHDIPLGGPSQRCTLAKSFVVPGKNILPSKFPLEMIGKRLLDEAVLGVDVVKAIRFLFPQ